MSYKDCVLYVIFCFVVIVSMTVKSNNKERYKQCMILDLIAYLTLILLTGKMYYTSRNREYAMFVVLSLIPLCSAGYYLSKNYMNLKNNYLFKAHTFEAQTPTHEDFIKGLCVLTICGENFKMKGMVYSNNRNVVITRINDEYENVDYEILDYNLVLMQSFFFISIGAMYIDISSTVHIVVGALLILAGIVQIIRQRVKNESLDMFLNIIKTICFVSTLSLVMLILFDKV